MRFDIQGLGFHLRVVKNLFRGWRQVSSASGPLIIKSQTNLVTTLTVFFKRTVFDASTCEMATCCSMLSLNVRGCTTRYFF